MEDIDGEVQTFTCDLREKLSVANLLSTTVDAFDRVDILVNASRQVHPSEPLDPEKDCMETMLRQNLIQHTIETRNAPPNVRGIELKWQDRIVPRDLRAEAHGVS